MWNPKEQPNELIELTSEQAVTALRHGIPVGFPAENGLGMETITDEKQLWKSLLERPDRAAVIVSQRGADPVRTLSQIYEFQYQDAISQQQNNMEKLHALTDLLEQRTGGRLSFYPVLSDFVDIYAEEGSFSGIHMDRDRDPCGDGYALSFRAYLQRLDEPQSRLYDAEQFHRISEEITQTGALLEELNESSLTITATEMEQWAGWLKEREWEQNPEPEPALEMGMG